MSKRELWIHHASLQWEGGSEANKSDIHLACERGADIVTFTEATGGMSHGVPSHYRGEIPIAAKENDYQYLLYPYPGQEVIMVKKKFDMGSRYHKKVHDGFRASTGAYSYPARFITWASVDWYGMKIWMHVSHWNAHVQVHGRVTTSGQRRLRDHIATTDAMVEQVTKHGKYPALAFFSGDSNVDEAGDNRINDHRLLNYRFNKAGLKTIWDAFGVAPKTHQGGGYDLIGSYDPKHKVKPLRYKVYPGGESDHRPISAWYEIDTKIDTTPDPPGTPAHVDHLRNFSDYLDNTVYDIPWALDDSDMADHDA